MNPDASPSPKHKDWRTLYRAAILEKNRSLVPQRVFEAEEAILAREREIFYDHGTADEEEAMADAMYALRAYKTARQHSEAG